MLISFNFGNFRSFRDLQRFSMEAAPLHPNDEGLNEAQVISNGGYRLLPAKAIFGANGSGKSNLAKAISAFQTMVSRSVAEENLPKEIWEDRFQLITEWDSEPIFFQMIFLIDQEVFRYGFQIHQEMVSYEWLYGRSGDKEVEYLMRTPEKLDVAENYKVPSLVDQSANDGELYRSDSLYLTAAALNGNSEAARVRLFLRGILCVDGVYDESAIQYAIRNFIGGSKERRELLTDFIKAADTGVFDLLLDDLPAEFDPHIRKGHPEETKGKIKTVFSIHKIFDWEGNNVGHKQVPFGEWESEGTSKLLGIGALILDSLALGRPLVIDEFDARFHPNLTLKIVKMYQNTNLNKKNAQLIFVTHDASLLRRAKLRRDQICLVNKDEYGISRISTLVEFKGVRKDASYEKEYLNGSYAAVPYLDKLDRIIQRYENDLSAAK